MYKCPNCASAAVIPKVMGPGITHLCRQCNHVGEEIVFIQTPFEKVMENTCERCQAPDADYVMNPYQKEINDKEVFEWMCSDCYNKIKENIQ